MDRIKDNIDVVGFFTSGLCALHCMAIPVLLGLGLLDGVLAGLAHGIVEWAVYGVAMIFAGTAVFSGLQTHASRLPLLLFILGFVVISSGMLMHTGIGHLMMALGGLLVASGHFWNLRLQKPVHD